MNTRNEKTTFVITNAHRWSYFQWFILGLYELEKKGEIRLVFKLPFGSKLLTLFDNKNMSSVCYRLIQKFEDDSYNLTGYIICRDGVKKKFVIDSADSPFLFDMEALSEVNCYFKMQYPIDLDNNSGFRLGKDIYIPWCDHRHVDKTLKLTDRGKRVEFELTDEMKKKIHPLMIGPRRLSRSNTYNSLREGYDNYLSSRSVTKNKMIMCYFGNAMGPEPEKEVVEPDYDWEGDLLGYFGADINHPNEKRAKLAALIAKKGNDCDARVISRGHSDCGDIVSNEVIPLEDFCKHISQFRFNCNVSGYRCSIPNRFIESFMVGTAIFTDKLHVRWYQPFDENEVVETVEMGYIPEQSVDWQQCKSDIENLKHVDAERIIECFNQKWAPEVVARYLVNTVVNS